MKFNMKNFFGLKILVSIIIVALSVFVSSVFLYGGAEANNLTTSTTQKAVIIDQLYDDIQNQYFIQKATELLDGAGYTVDIVTTKDVTIDFYKKLPTLNYKFVVIRTHGAVDSGDQTVTLFTGEKYDTEKYISEQLFGQVKKGIPFLERTFSTSVADSLRDIANGTHRPITLSLTQTLSRNGEYFAITPIFVDSAMDGKFSQTIFVLGGCKTMHTDSLAQSLVQRGASSVVGWDNPVSSSDNDASMLELLEGLLEDKMEMNDAMDSAMELLPIDNMSYPARMKVYSEKI
ncbi:MAG TPA: hypothetical protein VJJ25_03965 [Nitrosopumilaceae archaeon]|nr:hypothetical protein [Nitrosopumilaceae archaeon]